MPVQPTSIDGLIVVSWPQHDDERGFFRQTAQVSEVATLLGRDVHIAQLNHSRTVPGAVRGFHAEPWDKLVFVTAGTVLAAVADIRPESATFGEVVTQQLGDPPGERAGVFVAAGLANAYANIGSTDADYVYAVSQEWHPVDKQAIAFNDPDLAVDWTIADPLVSDDDRNNPTLRDRFPDHPRWR